MLAGRRRPVCPERSSPSSTCCLAGCAAPRCFTAPARRDSTNLLHLGRQLFMCALAQIRTCLWPRVGRWGIRTRGRTAASGRHDLPESLDRQSEAKLADPVLRGGRGSKQRRSGLFWSLPVLQRPARATEEACPSLPGVRIGCSRSHPWHHGRERAPALIVSPSHDKAASRPMGSGGDPPCERLGECHDRAHPRLSAQPPR
jgi:hypothetical protein